MFLCLRSGLIVLCAAGKPGYPNYNIIIYFSLHKCVTFEDALGFPVVGGFFVMANRQQPEHNHLFAVVAQHRQQVIQMHLVLQQQLKRLKGGYYYEPSTS